MDLFYIKSMEWTSYIELNWMIACRLITKFFVKNCTLKTSRLNVFEIVLNTDYVFWMIIVEPMCFVLFYRESLCSLDSVFSTKR